MARALEDLIGLLEDGYDIEDVTSTENEIHLTLEKGTLCVMVALDREAAQRILDEPHLF